MQESRKRSKKQQKVSQNHEHIVSTKKNDMKGHAKVDRH